MNTSDIITSIYTETRAESPLLAGRLPGSGKPLPGYADILALAGEQSSSELAVGLEYIFEGYLLHYGQSRLLESDSSGFDLLAGDYMYARGLERVAALENLFHIRILSGLISLCAFYNSDGQRGPAAASTWLAATLLLAGDGDDEALDSLARMQAEVLDQGGESQAPAMLAGRLLDSLEPGRVAGIEAVQAEIVEQFFPEQE